MRTSVNGIHRLTLARYDWQSDAVDVESPEYWTERIARARATLCLRRKLYERCDLARTLLDAIEHEISETRWGIVLVLAEEFVELEDRPDDFTGHVRGVVKRIHADLCRPRFAGWQPDWKKYRAWHLAVSERLLLRLADA